MRHLFLSDAHIGAFSDQQNNQLEQEICQITDWCLREDIQLHILGDLFDYWMEYKNFTPQLGKNVLNCIERYNRQIAPATYITGNHDNWTRGYFTEKGFSVHKNYSTLETENHSIFLHHGDGLDNPEFKLKRPALHRLLRNKTFVKLYQFLFPPQTGLKLMKHFSAFSRKRCKENTEPLDKWSEWFLKNHPYNLVICGHDHIPRIKRYSFGTYVNLGTFFDDKTALLYTNDSFTIVRWNGEKKTFTEFEPKTAIPIS